MPDWVPIVAILVSVVTAILAILGYVASTRSQERKRLDVVQGQVNELVNYGFVLQDQLQEAGVTPKPWPAGIFPKE